MARSAVSRGVRLCGGCGARNRFDGRACLRCRRDLTEPVPAPAAAPFRWRWLAAAAGVAALAAVATPLSFRTSGAVVAVSPSVTPAVNDEAVFERPRVATAQAEAVRTPVTTKDFARAGESAYAQGQLGVALSAFESAVATFPADPEAHNNLGQLLVRLGRVTDALPHLQAASGADPGKWTFRFNLARARGLAGDWGGAVADYQAAAGIFPDDHVTLSNLGRALQKVGRHAEAVTALERAAALDAAEHSTLLALAASYEKLSRLPDAVQAYRDFLDKQPQALDAPLIRARIGRLEQVGVPDAPAQATSAISPGA